MEIRSDYSTTTVTVNMQLTMSIDELNMLRSLLVMNATIPEYLDDHGYLPGKADRSVELLMLSNIMQQLHEALPRMRS